MILDKDYFKSVNFIASKEAEELKSYLLKENFEVFQINNTEVKDKNTFIAEISTIAPLQDEIQVGHNWDLLMDCFWQYATMVKDAQLALILENAELFLSSNLKDLWFIIDQFNMLSYTLMNPSEPHIATKKLQIFLVGEGPNFE